MLSHTDLKKGTIFIYNGQPCLVLDFALNFQGRGGSTAQIKIKNLATGNTLSKVFHPGDNFEEAKLEKVQLKFVYKNNEQYTFCEAEKPSQRFTLTEEQISGGGQFLKSNQVITGLMLDEKIINIELPIKVQLKVKEAAPYLRAGRAEAGTKEIVLETGGRIQAPSFIKEGDIIEINTQTNEYTRRVE